jgi:type VI secretion system protein ImpF
VRAKGGSSTLLPSLVDRLTDREPHVIAEPLATQARSLRELKASLRRDLEWLLNTRRAAVELPAGALARSVFAYGVPDLSGVTLSSERDRRSLLHTIEEAVACFEPRLSGVTATLLPVEGQSRTLRFQIEGLLRLEPAPERVSFDTTLDLASSTYQMEAERGA